MEEAQGHLDKQSIKSNTSSREDQCKYRWRRMYLDYQACCNVQNVWIGGYEEFSYNLNPTIPHVLAMSTPFYR